ncbi:MAG: SDR family oxidoreductase [Propionibacteriales bacterium]|nr:SDR family oxidoreductase [Propionibacteriales bacterium]
MDRQRVVVVTGASGGLGGPIARRFAAGGDLVYLGYLNGRKRVEKLVVEIGATGGTGRPLHIDLESPESVAAAFGEVLREAPTVDVLVNNAAYRPIGAFLDLAEEDWTRVLSANVLGAVRCLQQVLPGMRAQGFGRVLNISGLDAYWGWGNRSHVTVAKAGLQGLSRAVAVEFSHYGITVNTVLPGSFRTPRDPAIYPEWERMREYLVAATAVARQGEPDELAELCWWLASEHAAYITGQDIHINGGSFPLRISPNVEFPPVPPQ